MPRLNCLAVAGAAFLATTTAAPVSNSPTININGALLGFNPDYVHIASENEVIPERISYSHSYLQSLHVQHTIPRFNGSLPTADVEKRVSGQEDRYQYTNRNDFPWRTVGQIQWSNGVFCSGSLIGPRHVITARHCAPTDGGISVRFTPGYDNGPGPAGVAQVTTIITTAHAAGDCDIKYDNSIMILDQYMGNSLGYFGQVLPDMNHFNQYGYFETLGYPGDRDNGQRPYRQDGNAILQPDIAQQFTCDQYGPFYSDSDIAGGQSGSPFWQPGGYLWGVASVLVTYSGSNLQRAGWASGDLQQQMIISSRNDYP